MKRMEMRVLVSRCPRGCKTAPPSNPQIIFRQGTPGHVRPSCPASCAGNHRGAFKAIEFLVENVFRALYIGFFRILYCWTPRPPTSIESVSPLLSAPTNCSDTRGSQTAFIKVASRPHRLPRPPHVSVCDYQKNRYAAELALADTQHASASEDHESRLDDRQQDGLAVPAPHTYNLLTSSQYSTPTENLLAPEPEDEADDVLFTTNSGVRSIELNRPKKLNSLNGSMARKIIPRLQEWSKSDMAGVVVIKGAGRAFCAGGDVAALAQWNQNGPEGQQKSTDYFGLEYKLDHLIATYTKPYVAFMDGITMGGGVGLSIHAPFRIATENTVFAMPETTIGFFPDVGASFFLPRMEGALGTYLALTSAQLKGVDVFYHGIATHYIHSSTLPALEARLGELQFPDYMPLQERFERVNSTIEEYSSGLPSDRPHISGDLRRTIDSVFHRDQSSIHSILSSLEAVKEDTHSTPEIKKWAEDTIATLHTRSPIAVAVTLQQMRVGRSWSIAQTFQREYDIAARFMAHPDFVEGVTARLIKRQKGRPNWKPAYLDHVKEAQVQEFFTPRTELPLISTADYKEYPHAWIGLPREEEILREAAGKKSEEVAGTLLEKYQGKQGVREKVAEVMERFGQ
ncbi:ClpP/crotonase [Sporormia fimetaria CBS 119925]|uniref:3-hydroxyisobutyryl-CoA hydrolase n=1 Tax=Sporormia fimetaria CBS 119925 TaxID=1340428 RepID=A0A6A6V375_9PLEO|nr:ClpP/crotonase [Sporormia fimetaria CBS 119925]